MKKIRVSLIGYGLSGKSFHTPLIRSCKELEIVAVVSSRIDEIKSDLPNAEVTSFEDALKLCDLVVITSPHQFHYEQAKAALGANKHVVIEKPFTATVSQAEELFAIAKQKKLSLKVFYNRRYDADFLTLRKMIESKTLGKIVTFESHFDRFRPTPKENSWREEKGPLSGIWWDLGPHLIDQALILFGQPKSVSYDIGMQRDGEADDFFDITLKYDQGLRVHLRASCIVKDFGYRFRAHGTKGSVVFKVLDTQESQLRSGITPSDAKFGIYPEDQFQISAGLSAQLIKGNYLKFYKNLIASISTDSPDDSDYEAIVFGTKILNLEI
mgnify:CR=1 FL=1